MNTRTRFKVKGRQPPPPCKIRKAYRLFFIAPFGAVAVSWSVAAGLYVGQLIFVRDIYYIVPLTPARYPDAPVHSYTGPRPYWFYFYVHPEDLK